MTWIQSLRSGDMNQTTGALLRLVDERRSFCCLGVARINLSDGEQWANSVSNDGIIDVGYDEVKEMYGMDGRMQDYLIAMNDGQYLAEWHSGDRMYLTSYSHRDSLDGKRIIRNTNETRSFEYIARFLEIAWKLTNTNTAGSVRLPGIK